jgi:hypothetical protein
MNNHSEPDFHLKINIQDGRHFQINLVVKFEYYFQRYPIVLKNVHFKNVSMNTFESLKSLEKLDMGHNALNYIDEHAFADLFMLTELVLDEQNFLESL